MLFNAVIAQLTVRQALAKRRWIVVTLLAAIPIVMAALFHAYNVDEEPIAFIGGMLPSLTLMVIVPITALVLASATLGAEVEDGTVVYLLTKPISRTGIVLTKLLVTAIVVAFFNCVSLLISGLIVFGSFDHTRLILGLTAGTAVGSVLYTAVFLALGLLTRRGMLIGLTYLIVWEGALSGFFAGTRTLSIRQYMLSFAARISTVDDKIFKADLPYDRAWIMSIAVVVLATLYCVKRLRNFELGQAG
jgi:ABC-2 type transport system permease protein